MNLALALAAQLVLGQTAGEDPTAQGPAVVEPGSEEAAEAETVEELQARIESLEAKVEQLESSSADDSGEVEQLQERSAALEEAVQAPGVAADLQRSGRQLRIASAQNALQLVAQVYDVLETGNDDVEQELGAALSALGEAMRAAQGSGSPGEAERYASAMSAVSTVTFSLEHRDFGEAKRNLLLGAIETQRALALSQSQAPLPITAR